jgi:DNA primase
VPAKYLNSPETELFHKGSLLYNGAEARKAVHDSGTVIAVEGYVDAIQMVGAGFTHTVAPLGTALTERQLQILWRMADEPILCFDGDKAGVRAAQRAADLALPLLLPGKSLRFALLPAGQDPDDLVRSGGADAMAAVIAAARPLVDMIWTRETDAGVFDTPERRAALEAKFREIARAIGDESVRRHYVQAFAERIAAFFPAVERRSYGDRQGSDRRGGGRPYRPGRTATGARPPIAISDRLRRATLLSGRGTHPLREVVLVMTMVNHPGLLGAHLDEFAHTEFSHIDLDRLRGAILEIVSHSEGEGADASLRDPLAAAGFGTLLTRLEAQIEGAGHWPATPVAANEDAERGWLQALTLQRRAQTLHRDLREAEAALASDPGDANLARLVDIQSQLAKSEGTEALIEGFGAPSGRQVRAF